MPENLVRDLQTMIYIDVLPEKGLIKILDCDVQIMNENDNMIRFRTLEIKDRDAQGPGWNTKSFSSKVEFLKTKPHIMKDELSICIIYFVFSRDDFKNVNNATIEIKLKLQYKERIYPVKFKRKIKRNVMWKGNIT